MEMKTWQKCLIGILLVFILCMGVLIIGGLGSHTTTPPLNVSDLTITSTGYGGYDVSCNMIPNKDFSYLEMQVIFYDSTGAVIEKCPLVWNMNDVHKDQTLKINGYAYVTGDVTPASVKVFVFDNAFSSDESTAIYTAEIQN